MESRIIRYIGVDDRDIDLFEGQYIVPEGMCYNSYLIRGEKIAVMDSVDARKSGEWLDTLSQSLAGAAPDYLVVQHMEPDHSGSVVDFIASYPDVTVVCSAMAKKFLLQFNEGINATIQTVAEGDTLDLGNGVELQFIAAPMVHWPEVLMTYLPVEETLFSADGFGKFGVFDADPDDWACEARRYYFNICGKYGPQVAKILEKASVLKISRICPLHGPILEADALTAALSLYEIWSSYKPETPDGVLVAYASMHGNTAAAACKLAEMLEQRGVAKVALADLCRDDMAETVEDAFRMGTMVLACPTYDGGIAPQMQSFLHKLSVKAYQHRRVALIENGTWVPQAAKLMRGMLEAMEGIDIIEPVLTIRSVLKDSQLPDLEFLAAKVSGK